jgi:hypothetical protein
MKFEKKKGKKMNEKKLFGIGAVVLMLLVAFVPAINSMQLITEKVNDCETGSGDYDLSINVESCEYIRLENNNVAIYEVKYTITNVGNGTYHGGDIECKMENDGYDFGGPWFWRIKPLTKGTTTPVETKKIRIITSSDETKDEEHYLAGENFTFNIESGDINEENDITTGYGHFGWDGKSYVPTYTQIRSTMKSIENMSSEDLGGLFTPLKKRLGWVYYASVFARFIIDTGLKLLYEALLVGVIITAHLYIIIDWIKEIYVFLELPNIYSLDQILEDTAKAIAALIAIWTIIAMHQGIDPLIEAWEAFSTTVNNTIDWLIEKHWENPITLVFGKLDGKYLGSQKVYVKCRDQNGYFIKDYVFHNLDPTWNGEKSWQIHDCTVYASAEGYKDKKSPPVLSWAFSEGIMEYNIDFDKRAKYKNYGLYLLRHGLLVELFESWFYNIKPYFSF